MTENGFDSNLIVWYPFDDAESAFADQSGHHFDAVPKGTVLPEIKEVHGRRAAHFEGGVYGKSFDRCKRPDWYHHLYLGSL